ncbi:Uncharacterized protein APZ42_033444 [Daphnia magna]|uniref:Uncharacterized protein n=1 Tax=Daphnia magna TaxID=35525 RepID=A0A164L3Y9_9CRUS|nr:Uncharacterized protein APZ42_033444 [Daphnia magna]
MRASFFSRQMGLYPFILFGRKGYYGAYHTLIFFPNFSSSTFQSIFLLLMLHLFRGLQRKRKRNSIPSRPICLLKKLPRMTVYRYIHLEKTYIESYFNAKVLIVFLILVY